MSIQSMFTKFAGATAISLSVSGCMGTGTGLQYMDPYAATAIGAALGGAAGSVIGDGTNYQSQLSVAGAAIGGGLANAAIKNAQRCPTTDTLNRTASRDNRTNQVMYDQTSQSSSSQCITYGRGYSAAAQRPIF